MHEEKWTEVSQAVESNHLPFEAHPRLCLLLKHPEKGTKVSKVLEVSHFPIEVDKDFKIQLERYWLNETYLALFHPWEILIAFELDPKNIITRP